MKNKKQGLTRRDFLRGAAGVAILGAAGASLGQEKSGGSAESGKSQAPAESPEAPKPKGLPRVVRIRHEKALNEEGKADAAVLEGMLDEGVRALLGTEKAEEAWRKLLSPDDTLGIKSNVWRFLPTPPELEDTLKQRALSVGIPAERIAIDDRGVLKNPVFEKATALINARPLRTHHWSGVGSLIKNYIMFHPAPPQWHEDSCANLAGLWDLPLVKGKTRLNILVMLKPLFHSKGPHDFQAQYTWPYRGLLIGIDPVAVDATGVRILEAKRRAHFGQEEPFTVPPKHIEVAHSRFKLGVADAAAIDLVKLGWPDDRLI